MSDTRDDVTAHAEQAAADNADGAAVEPVREPEGEAVAEAAEEARGDADEKPGDEAGEAASEPAEALDADDGGKTAEADNPAGEAGDGASSEADEKPAGKRAQRESIKTGDLVIVGILAIILGVLLCLPTLMSAGNGSDDGADLSGGVAATVNGVPIAENTITNDIESFRNIQGAQDDASWAQLLANMGATPESLRENAVNHYVSRELVKQAAAEQQVEVSPEAVEEQITQITEQIGGQEAFEEWLGAQGMEPDSLREEIGYELLNRDLANKVVGDTVKADDEQVLEAMKLYFPEKIDADATSLDGVDEGDVETVRQLLESSAIDQAFSEWMSQYASGADVQVNEMPGNLPYDVDIEQYVADDAANAADGASELQELGDAAEGAEEAEYVDDPAVVDETEASDDAEPVSDDEMAKGEE